MKKKAIISSLPLSLSFLSLSHFHSPSPSIAYYLPKYQSSSVFEKRKLERKRDK
jgi:hypothetical protein